jgi:hypothetical protein
LLLYQGYEFLILIRPGHFWRGKFLELGMYVISDDQINGRGLAV